MFQTGPIPVPPNVSECFSKFRNIFRQFHNVSSSFIIFQNVSDLHHTQFQKCSVSFRMFHTVSDLYCPMFHNVSDCFWMACIMHVCLASFGSSDLFLRWFLKLPTVFAAISAADGFLIRYAQACCIFRCVLSSFHALVSLSDIICRQCHLCRLPSSLRRQRHQHHCHVPGHAELCRLVTASLLQLRRLPKPNVVVFVHIFCWYAIFIFLFSCSGSNAWRLLTNQFSCDISLILAFQTLWQMLFSTRSLTLRWWQNVKSAHLSHRHSLLVLRTLLSKPKSSLLMILSSDKFGSLKRKFIFWSALRPFLLTVMLWIDEVMACCALHMCTFSDMFLSCCCCYFLWLPELFSVTCFCFAWFNTSATLPYEFRSLDSTKIPKTLRSSCSELYWTCFMKYLKLSENV